MKTARFLLAFAVLAFCSGTARASGGYANPLYRYGIGSNVLGVGGAVVSLAYDPASILVNPAGAAFAGRGRIAASHSALAFDRTINFIGFSRQIDPQAGFSVSWVNSGVSDLIGYDLSGNSTGPLDNSSNTVAATFASKFGPIAAGVSAKWHRVSLNKQQSAGWSFNVGALARPLPGFSIGVCARDLLGTTVWTTETDVGQLRSEDTFPVTLSGGVSYAVARLRTTLAADFEHVGSEGDYLHLGTSVVVNQYLRVRAGYRWIGIAESCRKAAFAGGIGLSTAFGDNRVHFDYSVLNEALGAAHSLGMAFEL